MSETITLGDFKKLDIRSAKVLEASAHPNADKLTVLRVDIGGGEKRQIVAGIRAHYDARQLVGKSIVMLANLQPVTLRGVESQGMLLAASHGQDVVLLTLDKDIPAGCRVT
jgi:methionyl-tRNA synthetase